MSASADRTVASAVRSRLIGSTRRTRITAGGWAGSPPAVPAWVRAGIAAPAGRAARRGGPPSDRPMEQAVRACPVEFGMVLGMKPVADIPDASETGAAV